jgi:hypothetical protein
MNENPNALRIAINQLNKDRDHLVKIFHENRILNAEKYTKSFEPLEKRKDLGSKIKVYSLWAVEQCDDLRDEIEYLVNLILDDAPTRKKEMLDVLEMYKNHDET